jgi:glycosyltransferase involved in cell wall biosynthesis
MKILIAHSRYRTNAPSGENLVVEQETAALEAAGHQVSAFERCSDEIGSWSLAERAALPIRISRNRPVRRTLTETLERERPDVLHVHNTFPLLSPSVLLAARDARVPVVATIHNYKLLCASGDFFRRGSICHDCAGGRLLPGVEHGCYRGSRVATLPVATGLALNRSLWQELVSAYVFISAAQRDLMQALELPVDRVFVKHNFVHEAAEPARRQRRHGATYVGRLDEAKGTPQLMAAWDFFRTRHPDSELTLTVAGRGPLESEVAAWAARDPKVDYRGLVSRSEARRLVSGGLAAVVPSAWEETFGLVAVEAMASATAPVAPATGSFPELVQDGVDGVLFHGETAGLAEAFARMDRDPAAFVELGATAEQTYRTRFQPKENIDQLLSIYEYAVAHPRGAS